MAVGPCAVEGVFDGDHPTEIDLAGFGVVEDTDHNIGYFLLFAGQDRELEFQHPVGFIARGGGDLTAMGFPKLGDFAVQIGAVARGEADFRFLIVVETGFLSLVMGDSAHLVEWREDRLVLRQLVVDVLRHRQFVVFVVF